VVTEAALDAESAAEPEEIILAHATQLPSGQGEFHVRDLQKIVKSGIAWWEQQLHTASGIGREQAATALKDLSHILDNLSNQLARGNETAPITTRLLAARTYSTGCPVCGRGNRSGARFCLSCGSLLPEPGKQKKPPHFSVQVAAHSHVGKVRTNNEDTICTRTFAALPGGDVVLLLVADGMGGARAGEQASQLASETIQHHLETELARSRPATPDGWQAALQASVQQANQRIFAQASAHAEQHGMGTTLTACVLADASLHLAHVGDSRAYLLNEKGITEEGDTITQLSTDHTLLARLVDIGQISTEEARSLPQRNILYRALGPESTVEIDTLSHPLARGDMLLLCSDGLNAHLHNHELTNIVLTAPDLDHACERLVALANHRGGKDNISVVVAKVTAQ
jgi:protein phosphatase